MTPHVPTTPPPPTGSNSSAGLGWFREMLRIRMIEEAIADRYSEQQMRCPVHLSIGQESVAVAVSATLRADDQIVTNHRCHAHYLAKGGDLKAMLCELMGRAPGCCGGRGGSMHLFDGPAGILLSLPIVSASIPIGVGAALAYRQRREQRVVVVYLGDAALEEGVFHESANFAALHNLPVVFVIENNLYSVYTPLATRQPARPLVNLGKAHGMPTYALHGQDIAGVHQAAAEAVARARDGAGPSFLQVDTYRYREHCGPNYDNEFGYRTVAEYETWLALDPLDTLRRELTAAGVLDTAIEAAMAGQFTQEIDEAFAFAAAAPYPDPATIGSNVYAR